MYKFVLTILRDYILLLLGFDEGAYVVVCPSPKLIRSFQFL